jgi:Vitamin K-dependent gamma-carboxylase
VRRWIDQWNDFWFPESRTLDLARCRILAAAVQTFWFLPLFAALPSQITLLQKNSTFIDPQLLIRAITLWVPREVFFTIPVFTTLYWITFAAGVLAVIGLFTRTSLFLLTIGTAILTAHKYSYGDVHHIEALYVLFLLLLGFAPCGERLSVDAWLRRRRGLTPAETTDIGVWPLKAAHVLLAMTYFSTGATKLISGGLEWMNGYTLQSYTFQDAVARDIPLGIWLAQWHSLAIILSVFTILFETLFFLSLVFPRVAPLFFIAGIGFHLTLYATGQHRFFSHIVLLSLLLLFLQPGWWRAWIRAPARYRFAFTPERAG